MNDRYLALWLTAFCGCSNPAPSQGVAAASSALTVPGLFFQGDNFSGAERGFGAALEETWGPAIPGIEGETYIWPTPTNSALPSGMNIVRLPFQWERLQPTLSAELDAAYLAKLRLSADAWRNLGATVILDVHNYAYYKVRGRGTAAAGQHIGSPEVPIAAFVDLWRRLALEFGSASTSSPFLFGLMNEPHDISVSTWVDAAQRAVSAIRATGARNPILVPGADWTTATDFSWSQNETQLQTLVDPANNFAIEVHQYYDAACAPNAYVDTLKPFEDWAVANNRSAFLGELDLTNGTAACHEAFANLIDHLHQRAAGTVDGVWIGYTYWQGTGVSDALPLIRPHLPTTCANGSKDGTETARDCGGTCLRCPNQETCLHDYDCQSGFCVNGACSVASSGGAGNALGGASAVGGRVGAGGAGPGGAASGGAAGGAGTESGGTIASGGSVGGTPTSGAGASGRAQGNGGTTITGGQPSASGGAPPSSLGGAAAVSGGTQWVGAGGGETGAAPFAGSAQSGCGCRIDGRKTPGAWSSTLACLAFLLWRRRSLRRSLWRRRKRGLRR